MDITVIVATKNSARFLSTALDSLRRQQGVAIDLIVVDAKSSDRSVEIARGFGARVITQEEPTLAVAWNLGVAAARAPFLAFLDSDDTWTPNTLAERIAATQVHGGCAISMGRVRFELEPGCAMPRSLKPDLFTTERYSPIPGTLVVPTGIFDHIGPFDPSYILAQDVDWVARATNLGYQPRLVDRLVLLKRIHGANVSLRAAENTRELFHLLRRKIVSREEKRRPSSSDDTDPRTQ